MNGYNADTEIHPTMISALSFTTNQASLASDHKLVDGIIVESSERVIGVLDDDAENVFVMDEESRAAELSGLEVRHYTNDFEIKSDDEGDVSDELSSMNISSSRFVAPQKIGEQQYPQYPRQRHSGRNQLTRLPEGGIAGSLPIDIDRGCTWAEDFPGSDDEPEIPQMFEDDEGAVKRSKTMSSSRRTSKNTDSAGESMYQNIQAYSRSIVTTDNPERLFGQRPHRRLAPKETDGDGIIPVTKDLDPCSIEPSRSNSGHPSSVGRRRYSAIARDLNNPFGCSTAADEEPHPKILVPTSLISSPRW